LKRLSLRFKISLGGKKMKKLFSALFAVVFALTVSGFALAADNAAMPTKAEKAEKKAEKKEEMKMDNNAPAAEKPGTPSTQTPPKPKGN